MKLFTKKRIIITIVLVPLILIAVHFNFYFAVKDKFGVKSSVNPKATSYFAHSMAVSGNWVALLHFTMGIDYDSLILKPFLSLRDYFFQQGEKYIKDDNAEDAVWWIQNYGRLYGFTTRTSPKNMLIYNLDKKEQRRVRDKLYKYIVKLGKYEIKSITGKYANPTGTMTLLASGYNLKPTEMYKRKTSTERTKAFYSDKKVEKELKNIAIFFNQRIKDYSLKEDVYYHHNYLLYDTLESYIFSIMFKKRHIPKELCKSMFINRYVETFNKLSQWALDDSIEKDKNDKRIAKLFKSVALSSNPKKISTHILKSIKNNCSEFHNVDNLLELKKGVNNGDI